jgi:hypothetical protein
MLAADVTQIVLTKMQNDAAQSALVQMGASLTLAKAEVRRFLGIDAAENVYTTVVRQRGIFFHGIGIDVNFPADAAAVVASLSDAGEGGIIGGSIQKHGEPRFLNG